jgi:hypothetical protein
MYTCHPAFSKHTKRCAILSTFDLLRVRYNTTDDSLWRNLKKTKFWERDIWIIPIHRAKSCHWVLSVANPARREFLIFDSFASPTCWKQDLWVNVLEHIFGLTTDIWVGPYNTGDQDVRHRKHTWTLTSANRQRMDGASSSGKNPFSNRKSLTRSFYQRSMQFRRTGTTAGYGFLLG